MIIRIFTKISILFFVDYPYNKRFISSPFSYARNYRDYSRYSLASLSRHSLYARWLYTHTASNSHYSHSSTTYQVKINHHIFQDLSFSFKGQIYYISGFYCFVESNLKKMRNPYNMGTLFSISHPWIYSSRTFS